MKLFNEEINLTKRHFQIDAELKDATTGEKLENVSIQIWLSHNKERKRFYVYSNFIKRENGMVTIIPYEGICTAFEDCPRFSEKRFDAAIENLKKVLGLFFENQVEKSNRQENRNIALA